jgi:hypothetical protein
LDGALMGILQAKQLYFGNDLTANVYTVSNTSGSYSIVKNISICATANVSTVNVHILSSAGTPGNNNKILSNVVVSVGQTISYDSSIVLEAGQKIHITGSNTSTFTTLISGVEYSP